MPRKTTQPFSKKQIKASRFQQSIRRQEASRTKAQEEQNRREAFFRNIVR